jgi:hypothetical protein
MELGPQVVDTTHIYVSSITKRNKLRRQKRKWGMRVTVIDYPVNNESTTYILEFNQSNTNILDNDNWKVDVTYTLYNTSFARDYFAGNGVQTAFVISAAGTVFMVEVNGQVYRQGVDFVVAGQIVTFTVAPNAPDAGNNIGIHYVTTAGNTDPLVLAQVDVSIGTLVLNCDDTKERVWYGDGPIAVPKTWELSDDDNFIKGEFCFQISDVAALQTLPEGTISNDGAIVAGVWTPPEVGKYWANFTRVGDDLRMNIFGPLS